MDDSATEERKERKRAHQRESMVLKRSERGGTGHSCGN